MLVPCAVVINHKFCNLSFRDIQSSFEYVRIFSCNEFYIVPAGIEIIVQEDVRPSRIFEESHFVDATCVSAVVDFRTVSLHLSMLPISSCAVLVRNRSNDVLNFQFELMVNSIYFVHLFEGPSTITFPVTCDVTVLRSFRNFYLERDINLWLSRIENANFMIIRFPNEEVSTSLVNVDSNVASIILNQRPLNAVCTTHICCVISNLVVLHRIIVCVNDKEGVEHCSSVVYRHGEQFRLSRILHEQFFSLIVIRLAPQIYIAPLRVLELSHFVNCTTILTVFNSRTVSSYFYVLKVFSCRILIFEGLQNSSSVFELVLTVGSHLNKLPTVHSGIPVSSHINLLRSGRNFYFEGCLNGFLLRDNNCYNRNIGVRDIDTEGIVVICVGWVQFNIFASIAEEPETAGVTITHFIHFAFTVFLKSIPSNIINRTLRYNSNEFEINCGVRL